MADAAAVIGLARKVRPPLPCRPSKLRLLVLTAYCPATVDRRSSRCTCEQPGSRHSAPASRKISSQPFALGLLLHLRAAGHHHHAHVFGFTLRPLSTPAARRRSLMRLLVQLPMNTTSSGWPEQRLVRLAGPCTPAPSVSALRWLRSLILAGSGTHAGDVHAHARIGAVGDHRLQRVGIERDGRIIGRALIGRQRLPVGQLPVPILALRREFAAGNLLEGLLIRRNHAGARAAFDRHVADRHALFHRQARMASPVYSNT